MEVGLQGTTAADIGCPAVEATTQGVGMANVHLYGLDTCNKNTFTHHYTAWRPYLPHRWIGRSNYLLKWILKDVKWCKISGNNLNIWTHRDSQTFCECCFHWHPPWHASHPTSGRSWTAIWRTSTVGGLQKKGESIFFLISNNSKYFAYVRKFKYPPSGIIGVGGFTIVQPAFLNMSTWGRGQRAVVNVNTL